MYLVQYLYILSLLSPSSVFYLLFHPYTHAHTHAHTHMHTHTCTHIHTHMGSDEDYVAEASPSDILIFTAGSPVTNDRLTTSSQCFTVTINDDDLLDPDEDFFLRIGDPAGLAVIGSRDEATVTIIDDEIGLLSTVSATPLLSINEGKVVVYNILTRDLYFSWFQVQLSAFVT